MTQMLDIEWGIPEVPESGPTVEPVTLDEAKNHCNISIAGDNTLVENLITAARERVESDAGRVLITQTWKVYLPRFIDPILLPKAPVQTTNFAVDYVDADGDDQSLTSDDWQLNIHKRPAVLRPAYGTNWPSTRDCENAVTITLQAGYGDAASAVPQIAKQAIFLLVSHGYEHRETTITGTIITPVPDSYNTLIEKLRGGSEGWEF